jgi:hypothetical protein
MSAFRRRVAALRRVEAPRLPDVALILGLALCGSAVLSGEDPLMWAGVVLLATFGIFTRLFQYVTDRAVTAEARVAARAGRPSADL